MSKSIQYWNSRRASKRLPRVRGHADTSKPGLSNIVCFKAGMSGMSLIDESNASTKGSEIVVAGTILEIPKTECYGIRIYHADKNTKYLLPSYEVYSEEAAKHAGLIKLQKSMKMEDLKNDKENVAEISALLVAHPETTNSEQNKRIRFESRITGKNTEEKIKFIEDKIGKEIKITDVFEEGEYIDISSITKGKGWQGVIKRGGVKRNNHKSTQKVRHGGPLGAFTPGKIFYTIPRAGQMGFNYRTEKNKKILKISDSNEAEKINKPSGFKNYGKIKSDLIIIAGSIPGPAKRLVRVKKSIRSQNRKITKPKITGVLK